MKITITIPDSKAPMLQSILDGVQKLIGKDMRVSGDTLKPEGQGAGGPRKPSRKERLAEMDEMLVTGKWRKPSYLKKSK